MKQNLEKVCREA